MDIPLVSACRDVENIRNMLENLENNLENEYSSKTVESARFKALSRENKALVEELKQWKRKFEQAKKKEQRAKESLLEKVRALEEKLNEKKELLPIMDDNQNQACVCQLAAGNEAEETFVEPPPLPEKRLRKQSSFIRPHKSNPPLFDESCVTVSSAMKETGLNESIMTLPPEMTIISDKENASDESILINELVAAEKPSTQRISKAIQRSLTQISSSIDEDFDQLESIPIPIPRINVLEGLIVKKRRDVNWDHKNSYEDTPPKKRKVAVGKTFDF